MGQRAFNLLDAFTTPTSLLVAFQCHHREHSGHSSSRTNPLAPDDITVRNWRKAYPDLSSYPWRLLHEQMLLFLSQHHTRSLSPESLNKRLSLSAASPFLVKLYYVCLSTTTVAVSIATCKFVLCVSTTGHSTRDQLLNYYWVYRIWSPVCPITGAKRRSGSRISLPFFSLEG